MLILKIKKDIQEAMKNKDKDKLSTLRMLVATIEKKQIENKSVLTDLEVIESIGKNIKQLNQEIESVKLANREKSSEKIAKLESEKDVLQEYLPQQLAQEELQMEVDSIVESVKSQGGNMGMAMGLATKQFKGRADMKAVSMLVKEGMSK